MGAMDIRVGNEFTPLPGDAGVWVSFNGPESAAVMQLVGPIPDGQTDKCIDGVTPAEIGCDGAFGGPDGSVDMAAVFRLVRYAAKAHGWLFNPFHVVSVPQPVEFVPGQGTPQMPACIAKPALIGWDEENFTD